MDPKSGSHQSGQFHFGGHTAKVEDNRLATGLGVRLTSFLLPMPPKAALIEAINRRSMLTELIRAGWTWVEEERNLIGDHSSQ
jgi:hypothetical protein